MRALCTIDALEFGWPAERAVGTGLSNLGNTCFLNSVMQCLAHTRPLAAAALDGTLEKQGRAKGVKFDALGLVAAHVRRALAPHARVYSPQPIVRLLPRLSRQFRPGRQEDAHELSRYLIDAMQECSLPSKKTPPAVADTTFVHQLFGGKFRSQVKCLHCGYESNTFEPFLDLSLELSKRTASVGTALRGFTAKEILEGSNAYKCPRCNGLVKASKQMLIGSAPPVLTVHLKRFGFGGFGGACAALAASKALLRAGMLRSRPRTLARGWSTVCAPRAVADARQPALTPSARAADRFRWLRRRGRQEDRSPHRVQH